MKTINVAQAEGPVLDWLVATLEGWDYDNITNATKPDRRKKYSTDWSQGGPIIDREKISMNSDYNGAHTDPWVAETFSGGIQQAGPTPLIAAMRCFCCSKLGETVEVPEELT